MTRRLRLAAVLAAVLVLAACSGTPDQPRVSPPPVHGRFSYQIGGAYRPAAGVAIVDRDRGDPPAAHRYSICYVNAYQAQTAEVGWWRNHHDTLLLRDAAGRPVVDTGWREPLLDIGTAAKRRALAAVVGRWIDGCAAHGYRAVEPDNLDSYTRSHGLLSAADALAYARLLVRRAHRDGLALAQKNAAELSARGRRAGFDFAIAEECQVYRECGDYTRVYGDRVIEIEYTDQPLAAFTAACAYRGGRISIVLRDRDVTPAGDPDHVERWCRQAGAN